MYYDRFDIVTAYYVFFVHYHEGQWSRKYARLSKILSYFTPGPNWSGDESSLTDNGREIYDQLVSRESSSN